MSKPKRSLDSAVRVVFLALLTALMLTPFGGGIVLLVFVPVVGWFVWKLLDRTRELENRVAELEKKPGQS